MYSARVVSNSTVWRVTSKDPTTPETSLRACGL
jgi:hypothetical protein